MEPYQVVKSEVVYRGKIIDVAQDIITLPDGKEAVREVVLHGGAAAMVAVDPEGKLLFVKQYRHPTGAMAIEIPAGTLGKDEDPKVCAIRELAEETGYTAKKWTFMNQMYSAIGFCKEIIYIYLAEDLSAGEQSLDEDEFVTVERYSLEEAIEMIFTGEICDSKTIAGILVYQELKRKK